MQPGRHPSVASIAVGPPERRYVGILQSVCGILRVAHDAQGDGPHSILMPRDKSRKGVRVTIDMRA
jgi:hypothetical protein